jgi:hypothetical protein
MRFLVHLLAGIVAVLSCAAPIGASDCRYTHTYLGNLPKEGNPGWHSETQGIDHDATRWYLTQNSTSTFTLLPGSPIPGKCAQLSNTFVYVCPNPRLWRIPASVNLGHGVSCNDPHTSGATATVCANFATQAPQLWSTGYDHYGDIAFYEPDSSHGYLCVPLEGKLRGGTQLPGAFAFSRADDLSFVAFAEGAGLGTTSAWCAIDPSGVVYSSPKNAAGKTDTILRFHVNWSALALDPPEAHVDPAGSVMLQDENGAPLELGEFLQGGTFASAELLYLLNGQGGGSCPNCGIHVFELSDTATFDPLAVAPEPAFEFDQRVTG